MKNLHTPSIRSSIRVSLLCFILLLSSLQQISANSDLDSSFGYPMTNTLRVLTEPSYQCDDLGHWVECGDDDGRRNSRHEPNQAEVIYVNGICTAGNDHRASLDQIENRWGKRTLGIYNASAATDIRCLGWDGTEALDMITSQVRNTTIVNAAVQRLMDEIKWQFDNNIDPNITLEIVAHSQGAVIVSLALEGLENATYLNDWWNNHKDRIVVTTMGRATNDYPEGPQYRHWVNTGVAVSLVPPRVNYVDPVTDIATLSLKLTPPGDTFYRWHDPRDYDRECHDGILHALCLYLKVVDPAPLPGGNTISGMVTSSESIPTPGVFITVTDVNTGQIVGNAITSADGGYQLKNLPAGEYTIFADHSYLGTDTEAMTVDDRSQIDAPHIHLEIGDIVLSPNTDTVLIIDSSGSMSGNDPNEQRLAAAKAYLAASLADDFVAVVNFDDTIQDSEGPLQLPDSQSDLTRTIDTIDSDGGTDIGLGIQAGCNALLASPSSNTRKAAIFLTDGNGDFNNEDACFKDHGWPIYAFGFGSSDDALLQRIAANTGGEFARLEAINFACEFQRVSSKIAGIEPAPCISDVIMQGQTIQKYVIVPDNQLLFRGTITWPGSDVVMTLTSPFGRVIDRNTIAPDVTHELGATYETYSITNPDPGIWEVTLYGADVNTGGEEVVFSNTTIPSPSLPDLDVRMVDNADPVSAGQHSTYSITVSNLGIAEATGVTVTDELPPEVDFISATATQGTCREASRVVTCNLGELAPNSNLEIEVVTSPIAVGMIVNTITVSGNEEDYDVFNNNATEYTTIEGEQFCSNVAGIPIQECHALEVLFNQTNGISWTDNSGWMQTTAPCGWVGVICSDGSVSVLWLYNNELSGDIPADLGNLTNLTALYLNDNELSGDIPADLGNLTNLTALYLHNNQFDGAIPSELSNLTNLEEFDLSNNQLTGSIPPELGSLASLKKLYLDSNQLTGSIPPELGNLANLEELYLSINQLTGSIPPELGNLANLKSLLLSSNQLTGNIPLELGNLTNLLIFNLYLNQLTGSIPPELGNLANLEELDLSNNLLSGNIPSELDNLVNLKEIDLSNNQLNE